MKQRKNLYTFKEFLVRNCLKLREFRRLCHTHGEPRLIKVGDRILISRGAEWTWIKALEGQVQPGQTRRRKLRRRN